MFKKVVLTLATLVMASAVTTSASPATVEAGLAVGQNKYLAKHPCRLFDSEAEGGQLAAKSVITVQVADMCGIDPRSAAAAFTLTAVDMTGNGHLTMYPSGEARPGVSNVNYSKGDSVSNGAIVRLSPSGSVDIYTHAAGHITLDVTGSFIPATSTQDGRFEGVTPQRVLDTTVDPPGRIRAGQTVRVPIPRSIPEDAIAMVISLTGSGSGSAGNVIVHPAQSPRPASVNLTFDGKDQSRTVGMIASTSTLGIDIYSSTDVDVAVDVTGYITGKSSPLGTIGLFTPAGPKRIVDTRNMSSPAFGYSETREVGTVPRTGGHTAAIVTNWTIISASSTGAASGWPARTGKPATATITADQAGRTIAAFGIIRNSRAGLNVSSDVGGHLAVDYVGWFNGIPAGSTMSGPPTTDTACGTVAHVGDSLSYRIMPELKAGYEGFGFGSVHVDAFGARAMHWKVASDKYTGLTAVDAIKAAGHQGCWVIALGTNDTANIARWAYQDGFDRAAVIDDMMRRIDPAAQTPVMWVDTWTVVTDPAEAGTQANMIEWNRVLREATSRWPNMRIADWSALAAQHPEWYVDDGVHHNDAGHSERVAFITDAANRLLR